MYFYGSGDWAFVDFNQVLPFREHDLAVDKPVKNLKFKKLTPKQAIARENGIKIATKEAKLTNKWRRCEWLVE